MTQLLVNLCRKQPRAVAVLSVVLVLLFARFFLGNAKQVPATDVTFRIVAHDDTSPQNLPGSCCQRAQYVVLHNVFRRPVPLEWLAMQDPEQDGTHISVLINTLDGLIGARFHRSSTPQAVMKTIDEGNPAILTVELEYPHVTTVVGYGYVTPDKPSHWIVFDPVMQHYFPRNLGFADLVIISNEQLDQIWEQTSHSWVEVGTRLNAERHLRILPKANSENAANVLNTSRYIPYRKNAVW